MEKLSAMNRIEEPVDVLHGSARYKTFLYSLQQFTKALEKIRRQEVERYVKKLSGTEIELMEGFTTEFVNRIISTTTAQLKTGSGKNDPAKISMALSELFDPESQLIADPPAHSFVSHQS